MIAAITMETWQPLLTFKAFLRSVLKRAFNLTVVPVEDMAAGIWDAPGAEAIVTLVAMTMCLCFCRPLYLCLCLQVCLCVECMCMCMCMYI